MTYEEVAAQCNAAGFRVSNTFQNRDGWQANLHDGKEGFIFAHGTTPTDALERALRLSISEKKGEAAKVDDDILA